MSREQYINKFINFFDTCSDVQLVMINKLITNLVKTEEFQRNDPSEIPIATGNGNGLGREDADEGTWGSLYRSPDNE